MRVFIFYILSLGENNDLCQDAFSLRFSIEVTRAIVGQIRHQIVFHIVTTRQFSIFDNIVKTFPFIAICRIVRFPVKLLPRFRVLINEKYNETEYFWITYMKWVSETLWKVLPEFTEEEYLRDRRRAIGT